MNRRKCLKTFRVNHVPCGAPEGLALLIQTKGLRSTAKKLRRNRGLRLPVGIYYVFEEGRYDQGLQITFS